MHPPPDPTKADAVAVADAGTPPAPRRALPRRRLLAGSAGAAASFVATLAHSPDGDAHAPPSSARGLRVVMDADAAPVCHVDALGRPSGLAVELLQLLAVRAGLTIDAIAALPRAAALAAFAQRRADVLLDGVPDSDAPRGALFTQPYLATTSVLVSRLMGRHVQSLQECRGLRLAIAADMSRNLRRRAGAATLLLRDSPHEVLEAVASGQADVGLVAHERVLQLLHTRYSDTLTISALLPEAAGRLSFMLQPELVATREALDRALAGVGEASWAALRERWFAGADAGAGGGMMSWGQVFNHASPLLLVAGGAGVGSTLWIARLRREVRRRREAERHMQDSRDAQARAATHRQRFIAFLSHEARSLVGGIVHGLDLLDEDDAVLRRRLAEGLRANAAGLRQLLDESLDAAAIDAGAVSIRLRPVRLACLLHALREEVAALAAARRLQVDVELGTAAQMRVQADPVRLAQALRNLVFNALKFTERGGVRVAVELLQAAAQPRLRVDVIDTGRGMRPDELEQIFQPFVQVGDRGMAAGYAGSGLGLAIAQELVRRMGGTLLAASTPGVGSRFSIELPVVPEVLDAGESGMPSSSAPALLD